MQSAKRPLLISFIVVTVLVLLLRPAGFRKDSPRTLLVYCAAVVRMPVEEIARAYEKERGVLIQLQFGGSGTLLSNVQVSGAGDLFIAADASYIDTARGKNLVAEALPVVQVQPVLLVPKGNPKNIQGIADLQRADLRVSLANPDAASIGKVTQKILEAHGQWDATQLAVQTRGVFKPTVSDVANDVKLGAVDVGVVWNATAREYPELEALSFPEAALTHETVMVAALKCAANPEAASDFMYYLTAEGKGMSTFKAHGFEPAPAAGNLQH